MAKHMVRLRTSMYWSWRISIDIRGMGLHGTTGWWFQPTPLNFDGVKVTWDDDIPNR